MKTDLPRSRALDHHAGAVDLYCTRLDAPEQQRPQPKGDFGARHRHALAMRGIEDRDIGQPDIQRPIDAEPESLPGKRRAADGDADRRLAVPRRLRIGGRGQASGQEGHFEGSLRDPPGKPRRAGTQQYQQQQDERSRAMQKPKHRTRGLTGKPPHGQPARV